LSEKIESLKAFAILAFGRFDNSMKDLKESEIDWRPVEEANNIKWILTHLSQQWNVGFQRTFKGDNSYKPRGWPDDYVGNKSVTLARLLTDLTKGRAIVLEELGKLSPSDLSVDIQSPSGLVKRYDRLMRHISEIIHHEGQIAYIRGAIERRRQKDSRFLT
jgi:hypothetical protein